MLVCAIPWQLRKVSASTQFCIRVSLACTGNDRLTRPSRSYSSEAVVEADRRERSGESISWRTKHNLQPARSAFACSAVFLAFVPELLSLPTSNRAFHNTVITPYCALRNNTLVLLCTFSVLVYIAVLWTQCNKVRPGRYRKVHESALGTVEIGAVERERCYRTDRVLAGVRACTFSDCDEPHNLLVGRCRAILHIACWLAMCMLSVCTGTLIILH